MLITHISISPKQISRFQPRLICRQEMFSICVPFVLASASALNLDQSKTWSFGKGLSMEYKQGCVLKYELEHDTVFALVRSYSFTAFIEYKITKCDPKW